MLKSLATRPFLRAFYRRWWEARYGVKKSDVFLVSYPRSGNTWIRFMLLQARPGFTESDFQRINEIIPDMHGNLTWFQCRRTNLIKSHLTRWQPFRRVIYLVRDGRAATHSNWRYQRDEGRFHGSLEDFVSHPHWPSTWSEHVSGWAQAPETELVIRYEDVVSHPCEQLLRITTLLKWPLTRSRAEEIIANSTKEKMHALEKFQDIPLHRVGSHADVSLNSVFTGSVQHYFARTLNPVSEKFLQPALK